MSYLKYSLSCLLHLVLLFHISAQTCTTSWTGDGDGTSWGDADNWDNGVPGASDDVCITSSGTYTVIVGDFSVRSLALGASSGVQTLQTNPGSGNTMNIATTAVIGVNGVLEWNNAVLESGKLTNEGLVLLSSPGGGSVRGAFTVFRNEGTVIHMTGGFNISSDGRVENAAMWDVQGDVSNPGSGISGGGVFVNEAGAKFQKTAGDGKASFVSIGKSFDNFGTIDVQSGELAIGWPSTHTDAILTTSPGATLHFTTDAAEPSATFIGTTSGRQEGLLRMRHPFSAGANAVWNFTGNGLVWDNIANLTAGRLTNKGLVRIEGGTRAVVGATSIFRNEGTVEHVTGNLRIRNNGRIENAAVWDVQADNAFLQGFGGTENSFVNEEGAIFQKTGGNGLMRILGTGIHFDNFGSIDVQAGEVAIEIPSTHSDAVLKTSVGTTLRFKTGIPPISFIGSITGSQAGNLLIEQDFIAGPNAIWAFSGNGVTWGAGLLTKGLLRSQTPVHITSGEIKGVDGTTAIFHAEAPVVHENGTFQISGEGRVENASVWEVQGDPDYQGAAGTGTFVNEAGAIFRKITGISATVFSDGNLVVRNAGTISVESGEIDIDRPFDHLSGASLQGTGTFDVLGSSFMHSGNTAPGISPGILTWEGIYTMGSTATLYIEIVDTTGDGTGHDVLAVTGDVDVTQGILVVTGTPDACTGTQVCDFTILTFSGAFNGPFGQENLPPNARVVYPEDPFGIPGEVFIRIDNALPIELVSFKGKIEDEAVHLVWETASETNNTGFHIERKIFSKDQEALWEVIGWVEGQGSTVERQHYEFTDWFFPYGVTVVHYRLRQIDYNDSYQFSPIIAVELSIPSSFVLYENFPNPFDAETVIRFSLSRVANVRLCVYDLYGSEIRRLIESRLSAGQHETRFSAEDLPSGMYFFTLEAGNLKETKRMLVVR